MCTCLIYVVSFIFGIIAIVKGEFSLSSNFKVRGGWALAIGIVLCLAGPVILGTMFMVGIVIGIMNPENPQQVVQEMGVWFLIIEFGLIIVFAVIVIVMAMMGRNDSQNGGGIPAQKPFGMPPSSTGGDRFEP